MIRLFQIPFILKVAIFKYYIKRVLRIKFSVLESNWIYCLRQSISNNVIILKADKDFVLFNRITGQKVFVRHNSSDVLVYIEIFFHNEYALIKSLSLPEKPTIVDLGANVGYFAAYAKLLWPLSKIVCIEPYQPNLNQLNEQIRINQFNNIYSFCGAIWTSDEALSIAPSEDDMEWSFEVKENTSGNIPGITLAQIMSRSDIDRIDLLKIDIEGTESKLFAHKGFLDTLSGRVDNLIMETHDIVEQNKIEIILSDLGYKVTRKNELLFAVR